MCCVHTLAETPQPPPESLPGAATLALRCDVLCAYPVTLLTPHGKAWLFLRPPHPKPLLGAAACLTSEAACTAYPNMLPSPPAWASCSREAGGAPAACRLHSWMFCVCACDRTSADAWETPGGGGRNSYHLDRGPCRQPHLAHGGWSEGYSVAISAPTSDLSSRSRQGPRPHSPRHRSH